MNLSKNRRIVFILASGALLALVMVVLAMQPVCAAGPWYVAPGGDDGNDCLSPGAACATISGALAKPGFVNGDSILVATGTYTGAGDEVVLLDKDVTLSGGWSADFAAQSGISTIEGEGARRGITVHGGGTAVVDRFTVQNGYTDDGNGGGIYNSGTLTLTHCTIDDNFAYYDGYGGHGGGGIYNIGALSLISSTVSNNTASDGGGGIYGTNGSSNIIIDSQIYANTTINVQGGGVEFDHGSDLSMSRSWVVGNTALSNDAGGIGFDYGGSAYIENSIIAGNSTDGTGGGLWFMEGGPYRVVNSHIVGNEAADHGSAITGNSVQVEVTNTLIISNAGNTSIDDQWDSGAEFLLSYCDTYGNSPDGTGNVTITRTHCLGTPAEDGLDPLMLGGALPEGAGPAYAAEWMSYDYRLLVGSPAIDAGTATGAPAIDIEGNPRDATPDMGAYELVPGVSLSPRSQTGIDEAGSTVAYAILLGNHTGATDSFSLTLQPGNAWTTTLSLAQTDPIPDGESLSFTAWVEIPPGASPGEMDSATIQAASVASPTVYSDTATIETHAMGDLAYVTLSGSNLVGLVDTATHTVIGSVDVGSAGCDYPWRATMTPDGDYVYVSCYNSGNVAVIETAGNTVETTIGGIPSADDIAFTRDGAYALVGSRYNSQVAVVDTANYSVETISTPSYARSVAAHPYLDVAYATSGDGTVQVIDTTSFSIVTAIPVGADPWDVAVSPDGQWVFAGSRWGDGLAVIAAGSNTVHTTVTGLGEVTGLEVAPDGSEIYAAGLWNGVHVVDGLTFNLLTTVRDVGAAWELAVTCDGTELYVGNRENHVAIIDTATREKLQIPMPGSTTRGIAICPQHVATGMFLVPASQVNYGSPGEVVAFEERLVNASGRTDSFTLSLAGNVWDTGLSVADTGPVLDGDTFSFTVWVTIPVSASPGDADSVTLQATSVTSPTVYSDTATVRTHVMGDLAYVTLSESNLVALVDTVSHTAIGSIDVGSAGCQYPWRATMSPDGAQVYVACRSSGNVVVIETAGNTVETTIGGIPSAGSIAFVREGAFALVGSRYNNQVSVVDTATYSVEYISTPSYARSVAAHPYLDVAYATSGDNTVQVIDTTSFSIVTAIPVGNDPYDVAVSPDGAWVFAGSRRGGGLAVIAAGSNTVHTTVTGLGDLTGLEVAPDGSVIYASGLWNGLHIIDGATFAHITTLGDVGSPREVAVSCDGGELYIGNKENQVPVVDTGTLSVAERIAMPGSGAQGSALCPQAKQTGMFLVPASQVKYDGPGEVVTYEERLVNASGRTDSFTLSLSGNVWDTSLSVADTGPVLDGDMFSFTVWVTIPVSASPGEVDSATIQATSVTSPTVYSDTATVRTHVMGDLAYVTLSESNLVALVDTVSHMAIGSIDVGSAGCQYPWRATMSPDGTQVYVACRSSGNVVVIETAGNTVETTIGGIPSAGSIAFVREGAFALVGSRHNNQVSVVDTVTYSVEYISTPSYARSVAAHPYLDLAYATSGDNTVQVIDTTSFSIVTAISVGNDPYDVAVSPDGAWVFAGSRRGGGLAVIAAGSNTVHTTVTGLGDLTGLEVAPDGSVIYASGLWNGLHIIDGATFDHITTLGDVGSPREVAVSCDGGELYVGNKENQVPVVDTGTLSVAERIAMPGSGAQGSAICPQAKQTGTFLVPAIQVKYDGPGEVVTYEERLVNASGRTDSFTLSLAGNVWDTSLSVADTGPVLDGDSFSFTVWVTIPVSASPGDADSTTIQATSVTSPTVYSDTATVRTHVMGDLAYVTLSGSNLVGLVDTATHTVMGSVDVGSAGCYFPWRATMTPDGDYVYVSCYNSGNVVVIETAGNTVVTTIDGIPSADGIAFTRDGAYALVGSRYNSQVAVVDTATYSVETISTPSNARSVAAHPYLDVAYATSGDGTVQVIDTTSFSIVTSIPVGADPWDVAVSPDGAWVFAGSRWGEGLAVIAAGSNTVHTTVTGLGNLAGLEIAPDGSEVYAASLWSGLHIIDGATFEHITTVWDVGMAWELAGTCDGTELYVGNRENYVTVIDTATRENLQIPMPGSTTRGIAICPQYVAKGVFLSPPAQANSGGWGETVAHQGTLLNMTGATDTFSLELGSHAWDTTLSTDSLGPIASGDSAAFTVYVTVPEGAEWYSTDTVSVTATSVTSPTAYSDTASLTTEAYAPPQISVSPDILTSSLYVDEIAQETLTIGNGNGVTLEFEIGAGSGASFFAASKELYGYDVPDAWLRVVGTEDDTHVQVIDLDNGTVIDENIDLDRYETWDVYPGDGTFYKVKSDKRVLGYESDFDFYSGWHNTFVPSLDSGPVGREFIFFYGRDQNRASYVFALENASVEVYDTTGNLVASQSLPAGEYWEFSLADAVYHVISTGRIAIELAGIDGYTTVPSSEGNGVGDHFYFVTDGYFTGAFAVFAYEEADADVYDLDSGSLLYSQHIDEGDYWWQTDVGTRRLRLESTGKVEVWGGDAENGNALENLGDDVSFAGGDGAREYYLHSLMDGSVIFALFDNTQVDVDGDVYDLNKDEYLHLDGCCYFRHVQSNQPILIQTLGRDSWWNNLGTYLGGVTEGGGGMPSWLTMDSTSGTVATNDATPVVVTFDATGLQPGTFGTELVVQSNDPAMPLVSVPVSMTVEPTADMGWLEGTVTDNRTGDPLEATIVALGQPFTITADADTGSYLLWLVEGSYTLQVTAEGYVTEIVPVDIVAQQGTVHDLVLVRNVPVLQISPPDLSVTQNPGDVTAQTLTISNDGPVPLDFSIGIGRVPGGAALGFDGLDDQLNMGNSDVLMLTDSDFTIEAWISTTQTAESTIVHKHDSGWWNGYFVNINYPPCGANKACFYTAEGSDHAASTTDVNDGQWHHIAAVYHASGTKQLFVDGVLEDTKPAPVYIPPNTEPFRVGCGDMLGLGNYQGLTDEVRVWNVARSEVEIQSAMSTSLSGNEPGLVGYWKLDEGSGQTALDSTAHANNGQLGTTPDADPSDPSWFSISPQGGDVPWLTLDPVAGTVPAYSSVPIQVTFDAIGMEPGDHTAEIVILSNDPVTPSVVVPVEMTVNNLLPEVTVTPETQEVQYSDLIDGITIKALDNAAEELSASTSWSSDGSSFSPGLPAGLVLTDPSCSDDGVFQTCTWLIGGAMSEPAGTYTIRTEVSDGYGGAAGADTKIGVESEDADIWLDSDNPATIQVDTSGGHSPAFSLTAYVREIVPDDAGFGAEPGDISNAEVEMTLAAVGPGSSYSVECNNVAVTGVGYEQILEVGCDFDDVEVNVYHVQTAVAGGYYTGGPAEDVLVVFDPSLGSTAGGGWFYWPDTADAASGHQGDKTNFGYVMEYNRKSKQVKGSLLLIRHLDDGSGRIYRVKSNALTGLSLGEAGDPVFGWASFHGKCTYKDKDWDEPAGNHGFLVYVEDHGEPGRDADRFWIEVYDKDGNVIVAMSMDRDASENAEVLGGGNIVVPHDAE